MRNLAAKFGKIINYAFFSHYPLLFTTLLPTFRYFICHFSMSLNDKFGGLLRKGGIYIILYAQRLKNV